MSLSYGNNELKIIAKEVNTLAIEKYKKKKFSEAALDWNQHRKTWDHVNSPEILHNLGLTEFQLGNFGPAIAHLRQALHIHPFSLKIQGSLNWVMEETEKKIYNKVLQNPLKLRIFNKFPYFLLVLLFSTPLMISTYVALRCSSKNKKALSFFKPFIIGLSLSLIFIGLLAYKSHLDTQIFATFTGKLPYSLYSAPSLDAPHLGSIYTGDAFQILSLTLSTTLESDPQRQSHSSENPPQDPESYAPWILISTPITPFAWLKTRSFLPHTGKIDGLNVKN